MRSTYLLRKPLGARPFSADHHDCKRCKLNESCKIVCVQSHYRWGPGTPVETALFIVGEAPGANEDALGIPFVGDSGDKLESYYVGGGLLDQLSDVYAGNVVRCRPPGNRTPTADEIAQCHNYLHTDIMVLAQQYVRVAILCVGATAVKRLGNYQRLTDAFAHQGETRIDYPINVHFFYTYHPAATLPDRDPNLDRPVMTHIMQLNEWLVRGSIKVEEPPPVIEAPQCSSIYSNGKRLYHSTLALDIETWGTLQNKSQYTFCPIKARYVQGIPYDDQIVTVSLAWQSFATGRLQTGIFVWSNPTHRARLLEWITHATIIRGQHLQFDIKFLRACDFAFRKVLDPDKLKLDDLMVRSFLLDDLAPERSLDAIAQLYRVYQYGALKAVEDFRDEHGRKRSRGIYKDAYDASLWKYNCIDSWAAHLCIDRAINWTQEKFSNVTNAKLKTSDDTFNWYNRKLWSAILMEECGLCVDLDKLHSTHDELERRFAQLNNEAQSRDITLLGKGSLTSKRTLVEVANNLIVSHGTPAEAKELDDLEHTDDGKLSTNAPNRNRLIGLLPHEPHACEVASQNLAIVSESNSIRKLIDSYTYKLIHGRKDGVAYAKKVKVTKKGTTRTVKDKSTAVQMHNRSTAVIPTTNADRNIGFAFPQIIILPRTADWTGQGGGVRQYRWSMKDPDAQTMPPLIRNCLTTRYRCGVLVAWDYSQIEWRTAMYLANDPVGLQEIHNNTDIHTRSTEQLLFTIANEGCFEKLRRLNEPAIESTTGLELLNSGDTKHWLTTAPDVEMRNKANDFYKSNLVFAYPQDNIIQFMEIALKWMRTMVGKSPNFLWLYGGYPRTTQRTIRLKAGLDIPFENCTEWWNYLNDHYTMLTTFREMLLTEAEHYYAIHLPVLGQSRSFAGEPGTIAEVNREKILDMPIQAIAGNILQSAIDQQQQRFRLDKLRANVVMNWHDASLADIDVSDTTTGYQAADIMHQSMMRNWYLDKLQEHYGRTFPIDVKPKILAYTCDDERLHMFENHLDHLSN